MRHLLGEPDEVFDEGPYGTPILPEERPETEEERAARFREQFEALHPVYHIVNQRTLVELLNDQQYLRELEAAGVDNWEGCPPASRTPIRAETIPLDRFPMKEHEFTPSFGPRSPEDE